MGLRQEKQFDEQSRQRVVPAAVRPERRHRHYFRPVQGFDEIDIYRILKIFDVTDPCVQHAIKKLLVLGERGHKNAFADVQEAIDSLERWKEMRAEDGDANAP